MLATSLAPEGAEWNAVGQVYLVPGAVIVNPLTGDQKVAKDAICPKCNPMLFDLCGGWVDPPPVRTARTAARAGRSPGDHHLAAPSSDGFSSSGRLTVRRKQPRPPSPSPVTTVDAPAAPSGKSERTSRAMADGGSLFLSCDFLSSIDDMEDAKLDESSPSPRGGGGATTTGKEPLENAYPLYVSPEMEKGVGVTDAARIGLCRDLTGYGMRHKDDLVTLNAVQFAEYCATCCGTTAEEGFQAWRALCGPRCAPEHDASLQTLLTEIDRQLTLLRQPFLAACFRSLDPYETGYIPRYSVVGAPPAATRGRQAQLTCLRQLFADTPALFELSYPQFCGWMATDPNMLSVFIGTLFPLLKPRAQSQTLSKSALGGSSRASRTSSAATGRRRTNRGASKGVVHARQRSRP